MSDIYAGLGADDLVTGEAVTLELPPATLAVRLLSGGIDLVAELVAFGIGVWIVFVVSPNEALASVGTIVVLVATLVLVPAGIETWSRGKSLGKLIVGTRTVRSDAGPITARHALIRGFVGVVEIFVLSGVPALVAGLVTAKGQRVGDLVAGTYVVRDKLDLRLPPPVTMPVPLASWARTADIAPLPEGLAVAIRQLLGRLDTLGPDARQRLLVSTADATLTHVAPPPPAGTPPDAFLAAVQAERRDRDTRRLEREAALRHRLAARPR